MLSDRQSKAEWEAAGVDVYMIQQYSGRGKKEKKMMMMMVMKSPGGGLWGLIEGKHFAHLLSSAWFHDVTMRLEEKDIFVTPTPDISKVQYTWGVFIPLNFSLVHLDKL